MKSRKARSSPFAVSALRPTGRVSKPRSRGARFALLSPSAHAPPLDTWSIRHGMPRVSAEPLAASQRAE
jgi:hypothetical protein